MDAQLYKEVAKPPEKLNKTRGIGIIKAHADFVAGVVADDYEAWDDTIKELRILKSERDPDTDALVEVIWTRYCLREHPSLLLLHSRATDGATGGWRQQLLVDSQSSTLLCSCTRSLGEQLPDH